ncbi:PAF acetylhydrolase family protein [Lentithecium fluviatile CBS 122367]|uniref:1-alkyl-2-acetylglycerophosphocholine esterase n=1 Tax=Lentithecium fluviatile CBS 122367 TaxID=1168545 RepID=A0A6G1IHT1_9PLEO|nr:PAF acetylhydrolase family protein [Lentithecium fluviatile CBS 122367]
MGLSATLLCALLSLFSSLTVSAAVLPVIGTHPFDVATTSTFLTDPERLDLFANDSRARSIMVSSFYPVSACRQNRFMPYMPPATAAFQSEKFAAYGLPNGSFQSLALKTCHASTNSRPCSSKPLPLVLFSGALGTSRLLYSSMLQSVAAAGYLVLSIDHPYDADVVEFLDGTIITGTDISSDAEVELALVTRTDDIAFLHRQMANSSITEKIFPGQLRGHDGQKTAVIGHSLGGAAAAAALLQIPSLRGGLNLDGTMFGPVLTAGLDRPFMLVGHENKTQETDPSWKAVWLNLKGWKKEFEVRGAAHYSFSDLPLVTSILSLQNKLPPGIEQLLGTVEGHRTIEITVAYVTAFLDMVLKSGEDGLLGGGNERFSEVVEVA